jgi:hypothetical protein
MEVPWPRADGASIVAKGAVEPGVFVDFVVGVDGVPVGGVLDVDFPRVDAYDGACQSLVHPSTDQMSHRKFVWMEMVEAEPANQPTISHE